jgi:asparagine synthase (glutamine-hydrolysing)
MPGITGIIRITPHPAAAQDLETMLGAMRYNERFSHGRWSDESCGVRVGWTCHPGSFSDGMPVVSPDGNTVLIFTGEAFQEANGRAYCKAAGLLDLYSQSGEQFFAELNGWFAGVLIDRAAKRVTLFNDRYGMGRIYIHAGADEFLFASEAKALLKARPALRELGPDRLAQYLRYNCVLGERTLFPGISLLPKASAWSFERNISPRKRQYFSFAEWENQSTLRPEPFFQQWSDTIAEVFPRYAREGADVAISSTAGLDTRLIMAALREKNRIHPSYTFGGAWGELFDVSTSRKTASVYQQPHQCIRVNDQFLRGFGDYARRAVHISDGTHDAFGAHDVFFNEIARDIAPIRLTGKFGSEVVRIRRLVPSSSYRPGLLRNDLQRMVEQLPTFAGTNPNGHPVTRVVAEEIPFHEYARVQVEQSQLTLRTPYMDHRLVRLMYQAPEETREAGDLQERFVRERAAEFARFVTNLGRFTSNSPSVTRMYCYLFWALFKVEYIYLYATPHWATRLDRALAGLHLERLFSGRQKWEGYRIWLKTAFAEFVRDTLLDSQAEYTRYFDYDGMRRMVERHTAGTHNYLEEINKALTVQLIFSSLLRE